MVWRPRRRAPVRAQSSAGRAEGGLDTHADEGLLIAATALRLAAKNRLIVHALRDGEPFAQHWFAAALRQDIEALIDERETDARRLEEARATARRRLGRPRHFHDYRHADMRTLALREQVDRELAKRLRALLDDEEFTRGILSSAREAALDEIVAAHRSRQQELSGFARDERYTAEREDRLASVKRDLEALQRARSW